MSRAINHIVCTAVFAALGTAVIVAVAGWGDKEIAWTHWLAFISSWLGVLGLIALNEKDPISPLWVIFAYLFAYFFLRPFFVLLTEGGHLFGTTTSVINPDMFLMSSILLMVIVIFFLIGYRMAAIGATNLASQMPSLGLPRKQLLSWLAWMMITTSLLSYVYVVAALGGISEVMSKQAALVLLIPEKGPAVKLAWTLLYLYFAGVALYLIRYGPSKLWLVFLILGVLIFLTLGRRSPLLGLLVPLIVYRHFYMKKYTVPQAAAGGAALFVLFILMSVIRFFSASKGSAADLAEGALLESAEFFVWDMNMATITAFGEMREFRMGLDFLPYWLRSLFDLDPNFTSFHSVGEAQVSMFYSGFPAGIPSGIFGTLYMNFGWIGLGVGCVMLGWLSKFIHTYFLANKENKLLLLLGFPFFLAAFFYLIRLGDPWLGISMQGRVGLILLFLMFAISGWRLYMGSRRFGIHHSS